MLQGDPVPFPFAAFDSDFSDLHIVHVGDDRAPDVLFGLLSEGTVEARLPDPTWAAVCVKDV